MDKILASYISRVFCKSFARDIRILFDISKRASNAEQDKCSDKSNYIRVLGFCSKSFACMVLKFYIYIYIYQHVCIYIDIHTIFSVSIGIHIYIYMFF